MKMKPRFLIGDWVRVKALASFYYDDDNQRTIDRKPLKPEDVIVGKIVGAKIKFLGRYKGGGQTSYFSHGFEGEWDPPYLEVKGSTFVWQVRNGYLNTPYEALDEDIELVEDMACEKLPWRKHRMFPFTERDREEMRKWVKDMPRDSKGRWVK